MYMMLRRERLVMASKDIMKGIIFYIARMIKTVLIVVAVAYWSMHSIRRYWKNYQQDKMIEDFVGEDVDFTLEYLEDDDDDAEEDFGIFS